MPMKPKHGLRWKLGKAFLLQGLLISLLIILGVSAAAYVLEEVLVKQALRDEAEYFWEQRRRDPGFPAPNTVNLTGYSSAIGGVPRELATFRPGFYELPLDSPDADYTVLHVTEHGGERLYLVFDAARVNELAFYFGLVPLTVVLLVIYVAAWVAYRSTRRAVSPVIALAREVSTLDPQDPGAVGRSLERFSGGADEEVAVLADAMHQFAGRLENYVERERHFTRDVSHELRSPLTVLKMAADMLSTDQHVGDSARRSIARIKRAATDMEELVEAFLLLARESGPGVPVESVSINETVGEEIEKSWVLIEGKPIEVHVEEEHGLQVESSRKVLSVMLGNLIRNAFSYTDAGRVDIRIEDRRFIISDSGVGIAAPDVENIFKPYFRAQGRQRGGHGVGLTIVKRFSDRFGWPVEIQSTPGEGTRVRVEFPNAVIDPEHAHRIQTPAVG